MNKWDARFMSLARLLASWSKDPSAGIFAESGITATIIQ